MTVAGHFDGRPPQIVGLYQYLHDLVRQIGPITVDPQGRAIVFQVRARSIGVTPRAKSVDLTLDAGLAKLLKAAYRVGAQDATAPDRRRVAATPKRGS